MILFNYSTFFSFSLKAFLHDTSQVKQDTTKPLNLLTEEASPRKYDEWAGNPKGITEDKTRCVAEVPDFTGWHSFQCLRKRGFGPNGEYCKQHAKKFTEKPCSAVAQSVERKPHIKSQEPLVKKGQHCLPWFCTNCYHHSWKNCYGENPCTPVRLLTRLFSLTEEAKTAILILQKLDGKVPFEEREKWNKAKRQNLGRKTHD